MCSLPQAHKLVRVFGEDQSHLPYYPRKKHQENPQSANTRTFFDPSLASLRFLDARAYPHNHSPIFTNPPWVDPHHDFRPTTRTHEVPEEIEESGLRGLPRELPEVLHEPFLPGAFPLAEGVGWRCVGTGTHSVPMVAPKAIRSGFPNPTPIALQGAQTAVDEPQQRGIF